MNPMSEESHVQRVSDRYDSTTFQTAISKMLAISTSTIKVLRFRRASLKCSPSQKCSPSLLVLSISHSGVLRFRRASLKCSPSQKCSPSLLVLSSRYYVLMRSSGVVSKVHVSRKGESVNRIMSVYLQI